jgi:membrane-associated phospholipid phosphatase
MAVITGVLYYFKYPESITIGVSCFLLMILFMSVLNFKLKASLHAASSFFICMLILKVSPTVGVCALVFSLVVAWSRLVLKRHTLPEIIAGSASGILFGLLG